MTRAAAFRLIAAGVMLAVMVWLADPAALVAMLSGADHRWLAAGLAAALLSNVVSALRWRALTVWLGAAMSSNFAVLTYFKAMTLNALLPGAVVGGDLYRALALRQTGLPSLDAALSVLLDRISGLWVLLSIGVFAAAFALPQMRIELSLPPDLAGALCMLAGVVFLAAPLLLIAVPIDNQRDRRVVGLLIRMQARILRPRAVRQYVVQMCASLAVQLLSIAALAFGGRALGLDLPAATWVVAAAPIFLMAALPVGVGGWGTREAAAVVVLAAFNVPTAQAVGTAMIYGIFGLAQAVLGGLMFARRVPPLSHAG